MGAGRGLGRKKPHTFSGSPPTLGSAPTPFQTQGPHARGLSDAQLGLWDSLSSQHPALLPEVHPVLPMRMPRKTCSATRQR